MTIKRREREKNLDALDHYELLESIVDITRSPDRKAIERSLLVALVTHIPCLRVSIVPRPFDDGESLSELIALDRSKFLTSPQDSWDSSGRPLHQDALLRALGGETVCLCESEKFSYFFPLTDGQRVVSSLAVESNLNLESYLRVVDALLNIYTNYLAILKESESDKLTGLLNRRTFDGKFQALVAQQQRQFERQAELGGQKRSAKNEACSWLGIVDIDHFKSINDKFGHLYGDEILLLLSQKMQHFFRRADLLFRFGGEEFVVLLEPTDEGGANAAFTRFCQSIAAIDFPQVNQVTISIGFAPIAIDSSSSEVFGHADQALYVAKHRGRNQVSSYSALIKSGDIKPLETPQDIDIF